MAGLGHGPSIAQMGWKSRVSLLFERHSGICSEASGLKWQTSGLGD